MKKGILAIVAVVFMVFGLAVYEGNKRQSLYLTLSGREWRILPLLDRGSYSKGEIFPHRQSDKNRDAPSEFHIQTASSSDFMDISLVSPDEIYEEEWEQTELLKADYDAGKKELTLILEINLMSIKENNILLVARMALGSPSKVTWTIFELDTEEYFN